MSNLLQTIAKFTIIPLALFIQNAFHPQFTPLTQTVQSPTTLALGGFNPTGGGTYYLGSSIGSIATSVSLASFLEPGSNIPYTMSYLNSDIEYGTLDPNNSSYAEFISFTGITQNSDGTAMLTGVTRGLAKSYPYTASSSLAFTHSGQSIFILSNTPQFYQEFVSKRSGQTITGANNFFGTTTFSSTTPPSYDANPVFANFGTTTIASVGYVNSVAQQGAATATNAVAGITKLSWPAVSTNNPIAVGQNDPIFIGNSGATTSSSTNKIEDYLDTSTTSSAGKLVRATGSGTLDSSYFNYFTGTGSDGALNATSGTTTINLANASVVYKNYSSINISAGAVVNFSNPNTNGTLIIFKSQGTTTIAGTLDASGMGATSTVGVAANNAGIAGATSSFIINPTDSSNGKGGAKGISGGSAGGATSSSYSLKNLYTVASSSLYSYSIRLSPGSAGGSGGGGAINAGTISGIGGAGGGALLIQTQTWNFTGTTSVAGINGGNTTIGGGDAAGGGGGGAGGMFVTLYNVLTSNTGSVNINGGNGGSSLSTTSTSYNGAGGSGGAGYFSMGGSGGSGGSGSSATAGNNGTGSFTTGSGGGIGGTTPSNLGGGGGGGGAGEYMITKNIDFI